jgi:NADPH:quinone reductase-like Zn-dependent oxidoreductase
MKSETKAGNSQESIQRANGANPDSTMRAVVQDRYGSADVLRLARVSRPTPAGRDVLVRVHAAGLNRGTWHLMTGRPYLLRLAFGIRAPRQSVLGLDLAGTVVAVGPEVSTFVPGDEAFGFGRGAFAGYAVAREDKLAIKPANLTFEQAAVVPTSAVTALQVLAAGRVQRGERVLVLGASGAVGAYAVQLAKAFGAEVTGVASTPNLGLVKALGADHVVDYTVCDALDGSQRYHLIVDLAGNPPIRRLRGALVKGGRVVFAGGEEGDRWTGGMGRQLRGLALSLFVRERFVNLLAKQRSSDLEELAPLIESGVVVPGLDAVHPLDRVPEVMGLLESARQVGKVAFTP